MKSNTGTTEMDYTSYDAHIAGVKSGQYLLALFLIVGTIGNILSIIILRRKNMRKSAGSVYIIVLSCSDMVALYTGCLRTWLIDVYEFDIRCYGNLLCKLHSWSVYSSLDYSAWVLVAVTAERVALVWYPHKARVKRTKRSAKLTLCSILMCVLLFNSHILYGIQNTVRIAGNTTTVLKCSYIDVTYGLFFEDIWPWMDMMAYCWLPFFFLLIGNILIITKVISSRRTLKRQIAPFYANTPRKWFISSMSIMLITLNSVFLLCTTPVSIYLVGFVYWFGNSSMLQKANLSLGWNLVFAIMYGNNAINFFLCLSGSRFRNEFRLMIMETMGIKQTATNRQQHNQTLRTMSPQHEAAAITPPPTATERSKVRGSTCKDIFVVKSSQ